PMLVLSLDRPAQSVTPEQRLGKRVQWIVQPSDVPAADGFGSTAAIGEYRVLARGRPPAGPAARTVPGDDTADALRDTRQDTPRRTAATESPAPFR
ncbi:MAG TPA: hypothetical protein VML55_11400, partial [Planctomycetaceae bacterium]|nr:hypothetical protein [Planctomycetaceae bacterium]